jgi:hypothetical protein
MQGSKVIPLLFNLEFSDISGPLAQFQAKKFDRDGLSEVVGSINKSCEAAVPDDRKNQLFAALWPELEKQIHGIPAEAPTAKHMRPHHEILEELVSGVRGLDSRFREVEGTVMEAGPRFRRGRLRHFHPMMMDEMAHMVSEEGDDHCPFNVRRHLARRFPLAGRSDNRNLSGDSRWRPEIFAPSQ